MIPPAVSQRAIDDPGFAYFEIDAVHDVMITDPALVTEQLVAIAETL
jgi:hypothetical protein